MVVSLNMKKNMEYTSLEVWIESRKLTNLVYEKMDTAYIDSNALHEL